MRFHSLPESKRYPESEAEYRIILDRYNAVLGALAMSGSGVTLLTTEFSERAVPCAPPEESSGASWWRSVEDDGVFWHVYAEEVVWQQARFDPLIRKVADGATSNLMVCDTECRWIFHPYDGGMDIVLDSTAARDQLRAEFQAWLSPRPDGL